MKRVLGWLLLLPLLALCVLLFMSYLAEREEPVVGGPAQDATVQAARGRYLALAGDCAACHTARGGATYAGGREIQTPFGSVYSSNLTPDSNTGLGAWSSDDFWRALHHGKSKDGRLLYPAFPYPNYTKVTRADADALFAYLKTLAPVAQANREAGLRFPYNQRLLLAGWRALYFRPGVFQPEAAQSAQWNRGAYLVQGLGHCNACHTSRDPLGGSETKADLAGGMIPVLNWYAPALTSGPESGLAKWDATQLARLLKTGVSDQGAVYGPMAETVYKSLQYLSDEDMGAMAGYLKSLPPARASAAAPPPSGESLARVMESGGRLYAKYCADCHGANGAGAPPAYPPLAGNHSLTMESAVNPIRMVLNGGFPPGTGGNPRPYGMPPFRLVLSGDETAAVVTYVRNSWGNSAGVVSPVEVSRYAAVPLE
ncbi:MAG: putative diheme cytochrome c-553 [Betaproteobacteria bacterium]|nr:putative diheme cytochrome c-553 [Betaproteobacteria bacterium]